MYGFQELLTFVLIMQTQDTITSAQNPKIKALLQLQQKSACRREQGLFVVEGRRELMHCLSKGYQADTMFVCNEIMTAEEEYDKLLKALPSCKTIYVSANVYERIAYRGGTEGIVATIRMKQHGLDTLPVPSQGHAPLYVVLESVEKPGNLGAILRSRIWILSAAVVILTLMLGAAAAGVWFANNPNTEKDIPNIGQNYQTVENNNETPSGG